jgi:large subunit ribosomal protein L10
LGFWGRKYRRGRTTAVAGSETRFRTHGTTATESKVNREQKQELITSLNALLAQQVTVVVTHNQGLTVAETQELRKRIRAAGAGFRVAKNRLARRALAGTKFEGLAELLKGPTGIAFSKDPVAAAKVCSKFAKDNKKLVILGGSFDGQTMDQAGINTLATMPSMDELRAKLVGMIQTPATRIAGLLAAPGGQIARVLAARAKQGEAA